MSEGVAFSEGRRFTTGMLVHPISGSHHYVVSGEPFTFTSGFVPALAPASEELLRTCSAGWSQVASAEDWQCFRILASGELAKRTRHRIIGHEDGNVSFLSTYHWHGWKGRTAHFA